MDDASAFFDSLIKIAKKGERECVVRSWRNEKKHLTVALSAIADGQMLPLMFIFRGKTDQTIRNLNIFPGFNVKPQEKVWMDDNLTKV